MKSCALFQIVAVSLLSINVVVNAVPVPSTEALSSGPGPIPLWTRYLFPDIGLEARGAIASKQSSSPSQPENVLSIHDLTNWQIHFLEEALKARIARSDFAQIHLAFVDGNQETSKIAAAWELEDEASPARVRPERTDTLSEMYAVWKICRALKKGTYGSLDAQTDNDVDVLMATTRAVPGFNRYVKEHSGHETSSGSA
ncbi:hypothetical protein H0H93_014020 [Arthromyces matolae]|nr:hypothetical protein H0H93_014020 [Arthromyces matolae]